MPNRPLPQLFNDDFIQHTAHGSMSNYHGLALKSAFQPIFSIAHRRAVGHEALIRAQASGGSFIPPPQLFEMAKDETEMVFLDRLCRQLHLVNFLHCAPDNSWLFLNVAPQVALRGKNYGSYFASLLEHYRFPAHRIVIEILEGAISEENQLASAVAYYRELGCLIAIDDFGAGHSNFNRIWHIQPDIVKLDRSIVAQATGSPFVRRVLPNLVSMIHESGSLALMEGVETEDEAMIGMDAGIDLIQGYLFGRPGNLHPESAEAPNLIPQLCCKYRAHYESKAKHQQSLMEFYITQFREAAEQWEQHGELKQACAGLLAGARAERCYLLDAEGQQAAPNLDSPGKAGLNHLRFSPVADARGATWSRRHYFRRAITAPGEIQISRPYLSIIGATMCITLSITVNREGGLFVLCCDLNWEDQEQPET